MKTSTLPWAANQNPKGQPATIVMKVRSSNDVEMIGSLPKAVQIISASRSCAWARGGHSITCSFVGGKHLDRVKVRVMPVHLTSVQQPPLAKLYAKARKGATPLGNTKVATDTVVVYQAP